MAELQHRVNNMLMAIQAIARLTRLGSTNVDQFADALENRLAAFARTNLLLGRTSDRATIRQILLSELNARGVTQDGGTLRAEGPDFVVPAKEAQLLSMVFHELAMNAVKYGALSVPAGSIQVVWTVSPHSDADIVRIVWREFGAVIKAEPTRRGFGSEMLEKSIPTMFRGSFVRNTRTA